MLGDNQEAAGLIRELEAMGLILWLGEDGVVHGRMREGTIPFGARPLIESLQVLNEQAAELLQADPGRVKVAREASADAIRLASEHGFIRVELLLNSNSGSELCDAYYREVQHE